MEKKQAIQIIKQVCSVYKGTIAGGGNSFLLSTDYMKLNPVDTAPETCDTSMLGAIYFDVSEDGMCQCKSTGWKVIEDGSDCTWINYMSS